MKKWRWPALRPAQTLAWALVLALGATSWASASSSQTASATTSTGTTSTSSSSAGAALPAVTTTDPDQGSGDDHDLLDADGDNDEAVQGLAVASAVLPQAMQGQSYGYQLTASGGSGYSWSGAPPFGLNLSPSGLLSGKPKAATVPETTSFPVSVSATVQPVDEDDSGAEQVSESPSEEVHETPAAPTVATVHATLSLTLVPPIQITSGTTLPDAHVGVPYAFLISAAGGSSAAGAQQFSWTLTSATFVHSTATATTTTPGLPPGLSLSPDGVLSGSPTQSGLATLTVQTTNPTVPGYPSTGQTTFTKTQTFQLSVLPTTLRVLTDVLPDATVGEAYNQTLQSTGGTPGYQWSLASGELPAGLTLSPGGVLSGNPTTASVATFTAQVTDNGAPASAGGVPAQQTASVLLDIVVSPASGLSIGFVTLPAGSVGTAYGPVDFTVSGGKSPYTWSLAGTSTPLPSGLLLSSGGQLSGTPTEAFSGDITVHVIDSSGLQAQASFPLSIGATGPKITTQSLPDATVGTAYQVTLQASGGRTPYTWSVPSAAPVACKNAPAGQNPRLPCGLGLSSGGVLSGTPASGSGGTYDIAVEVTDSSSPTAGTYEASLPLTIASASALTITTPANLPDGEETVPYSQALQATGGNGASTYNWLLGQHAALPNGLQLQPYNCSSCGEGVISGTPDVGTATGGPSGNGQYSFQIQVTDNAKNEATQTFNLTVKPVVKITTTSVSNAEVGTAYSATLDTTGGSGSNTWSVSAGALPAGLSLKGNGASATIAGTPTAASSAATFTIEVKDSLGGASTQSFTMTVFPQLAVTVSPSTPPTGEVGTAYSGLTFPPTGGRGSASYVWSASGLPSGLVIDPSSGAVSGTPTASGTFSNVKVTVKDGIGSASVTTSITIDKAITGIAVSPTSGTPGKTYTGTLSASGGTGTYTWRAPGLPGWLQLTGDTLSGTMPSTSANYTFTVTATDGIGSASSSVTISG